MSVKEGAAAGASTSFHLPAREQKSAALCQAMLPRFSHPEPYHGTLAAWRRCRWETACGCSRPGRRALLAQGQIAAVATVAAGGRVLPFHAAGAGVPECWTVHGQEHRPFYAWFVRRIKAHHVAA